MTIPFTPDDTIQGDLENAARLLSASLRTHENGLPEWAKNSCDAYLREQVPEDQRIIVLIFHQKSSKRDGSIACLDFVGMTRERIENHFRRWADPNSYRGDLFEDVRGAQGGHGNGGKSYMVRMFDKYSYFLTVRGNKGNRYGFLADQARPGYFPNPQKGRDFRVDDRKNELRDMLQLVGCQLSSLPGDAIRALENRDGFTCLVGVGPREISKKIPVKGIVDALLGHHQMLLTLQLCKVYVMLDGKPFNDGQPLFLPDIEPMLEAREPRIIPIPEKLSDPQLDQEVSTTADGQEQTGSLKLCTSKVSMRFTLKHRHTITYRGKGNYLGQVLVRDLNMSHYGDQIYGECTLDALAGFETNLRDHPADSPLTRAVEEWVREQITAYANEFVSLEKLRTSQESKDELQRMNQALNRWKNQFLTEMGIGPGVEQPPPPPPPRPRHPPAKIRVRLQHDYAGRSVTFRPRIEFFDLDGARVSPVPYRWHSSDPEVATVQEESLTITTHQPGKSELWAETLKPGIHGITLKSNRIVIEVLDVEKLEVLPTEARIHAGGFASLTAVAILRSGDRKAGVFVNWSERDPAIAKVSPAGVVSALSEGRTTVVASEAHCQSNEVPIYVRPPLEGDKGFPRILLSEIDGDPLDPQHEPPHFAAEAGPVCQPDPRYVEQNIWWINMACPLARRYVEEARGYGSRSREWRVYHLERYIEALVRIKLSHAFLRGEELPYDDMERRWRDEAVIMQERAVVDLEAFLDNGVLPGSEREDANDR
jgi:hypothetical protein